MKLNLFILSATAMVNAVVSGTTIVDLGTAGDFAILSKSGISAVAPTMINGDIAVSPIAATAITGFSLILDSTTTFSKSTMVKDEHKAYAADYTSPTSSDLTTAVSNMETAYTDAAGRITSTPLVDYLNPNGGEIGGATLAPGVYAFDRDVTISDDLYFEIPSSYTPEQAAAAVFIIRTTKSVKQAAYKKVTLENGVLASNIFWSVAEEFIMEDEAHMEGVLLVKTAVTMKTGSSLNGRVLSQTAVVLQAATIN